MTFSARPRKQFGQHWLQSETVLSKIVEAAALKNDDCILEIGPGTGVLTHRLLSQAQQVVAVEIDYDLCHKLVAKFAGAQNLLLLQGDFLTMNLTEKLSGSGFQDPNKVVANIPYYITGPILERLLGTIIQPQIASFDQIVLLVQQDIANRLCAQSGTKTFGGLTVKVQYLADCEIICSVPPKAFHPPPKVWSAVIRLSPRPFPLQAQDPQLLQQLVKLGFANKRKMLRNNLSSIIERSQLLALFEMLNIADNVRAEDLSVAEWVSLSNKMLEQGHLT
ncbi:16S rRNA (adenine(1518)-N(6)/adenine(1519)-N(6))-dimethyltransferase RsmA [Oscillatoria sp. CS-180]|uniref:16S rRNA (adenine(1518)-N(6)/adenine(1519)-N(6))- dimethyltransferase RsmA n=1 Tax=Oscillatoria sp. CS-180 TaxID=3021720 RepID=UPI00232A80F2|nr:16S rRNA (adenine(1518)-N(6)/adenine(1519)-N(6))-dimethyltransferase RsmA [Oscillatoria sp. CS-180]MDB9528008.1 16S rRNA (adenine(1518)-N(6)/adenine(1519)-N(6))-dimethyltransferase RsmA [Oscillatoria sp. CS-180]